MLICPGHKALPLKFWGWLVLLFTLAGSWSNAQTVILHLRNGDRLSGRLIAESTNEVVIATAFSDRLNVPANLISRRESVAKQPALAAAAADKARSAPSTNQPVRTPAPASGVVGELVLTNRPSLAQTAGGAAKSTPTKPEPPKESLFKQFISDWHGEAQLGGNLGFSTKERKALTGLIRMTHNHTFPNQKPLRNILGYDVSYGTTDDVLSDNRMDGTWKVEYDVSKRFLLYNASRAGYDEVRGIDLQYDFGPGLGYKWFVRTNFVFKNELGADYQEQRFVGDGRKRRYSLRIAEDLWWQITPKLRWDEKVEFYPELQESGRRYRLRVETNLSYLFKQNLTLTLNVVDLYDTQVPDGVSKNDLQVRSLLGIKF